MTSPAAAVRASRSQNEDARQCNGFVVVSSWMDPTRVVPPYRYRYSYNHFDTLNEAVDAYTDLEDGDGARNHEAVGIFYALNGMPVGEPLSASYLTALVNDTRRAA